jgi:hypothetical protein
LYILNRYFFCLLNNEWINRFSYIIFLQLKIFLFLQEVTTKIIMTFLLNIFSLFHPRISQFEQFFLKRKKSSKKIKLKLHNVPFYSWYDHWITSKINKKKEKKTWILYCTSFTKWYKSYEFKNQKIKLQEKFQLIA